MGTLNCCCAGCAPVTGLAVSGVTMVPGTTPVGRFGGTKAFCGAGLVGGIVFGGTFVGEAVFGTRGGVGLGVTACWGGC